MVNTSKGTVKVSSRRSISSSFCGPADTLFFTLASDTGQVLAISSNADQVLGEPIRELLTHSNLFLRRVHPDDRFLVLSELEAALQGTRPLRITYRWIIAEVDRLVTLHARGNLTAKRSGTFFEGFITDMSQEIGSSHEVGTRLIQALRNLSVFVLFVDPDLRILFRNNPKWIPSLEPALKIERAIVGCRFLDVCNDPLFRSILSEQIDRSLHSESPVITPVVAVGDRTFRVEISPASSDGMVILISEGESSRVGGAEPAGTDSMSHILSVGAAYSLHLLLQECLGLISDIQDHAHEPAMVLSHSHSVTSTMKSAHDIAVKFLSRLASSSLSKNLTPIPIVPRGVGTAEFADPSLVLLLESDPLVRKTIAALLGDLGHRCVEVDSQDAVRSLIDRGEATPGLLIVDGTESHENALEVIRFVRSRLKSLPVLCLTDGRAEPIRRFRDAGCSRFLKKPFDVEMLRGTIESIVEKPSPFSKAS